MKSFKCQELGMILLGSFILATTLYFIHFQNNLAEGGFIGVALVLKNIFNISPSITTLVLDIPIILIAWQFIGTKLVVNTLIGATSFSVFYSLIEQYSSFVLDLSNYMFVAAISGGVLVGLGLGLILRFGGATGGDDILSILLSKHTKLTIGQVFFVFDAIVLTISLSYLSFAQFGYTMLAVATCAKVMDFVYYAKKPETININLPKKQVAVK